jgi:hypothetical protein
MGLGAKTGEGRQLETVAGSEVWESASMQAGLCAADIILNQMID